MSDNLIAQVRALAEAQGDGAKWVKIEFPKVVWGTIFDFPALLAHLERTQVVVDAAREALWKIAVLRQGCKPPEDGGNEIAWDATGIARAALENLENTDGK